MIDKPKEGAIIIWQETSEGAAEPAIVVEPYTDVIQIVQEGERININYESVKEICKVLNSLKR
jgi:DNA uptake protein ComE-like DNA-binding protein